MPTKIMLTSSSCVQNPTLYIFIVAPGSDPDPEPVAAAASNRCCIHIFVVVVVVVAPCLTRLTVGLLLSLPRRQQRYSHRPPRPCFCHIKLINVQHCDLVYQTTPYIKRSSLRLVAQRKCLQKI